MFCAGEQGQAEWDPTTTIFVTRRRSNSTRSRNDSRPHQLRHAVHARHAEQQWPTAKQLPKLEVFRPG